jgi:hypothetical protein
MDLFAYLGLSLLLINKGEVHQVRCMIYTFVERKDKLLTFKLDSLFTHVDRWKCKISMLGVDASSYYMNKNYVHSKNERQYTISQRPSVLDLSQFVTLYHILAHGRLMTNFERFKVLFQIFKMKNVGKKHWSD